MPDKKRGLIFIAATMFLFVSAILNVAIVSVTLGHRQISGNAVDYANNESLASSAVLLVENIINKWPESAIPPVAQSPSPDYIVWNSSISTDAFTSTAHSLRSLIDAESDTNIYYYIQEVSNTGGNPICDYVYKIVTYTANLDGKMTLIKEKLVPKRFVIPASSTQINYEGEYDPIPDGFVTAIGGIMVIKSGWQVDDDPSGEDYRDDAQEMVYDEDLGKGQGLIFNFDVTDVPNPASVSFKLGRMYYENGYYEQGACVLVDQDGNEIGETVNFQATETDLDDDGYLKVSLDVPSELQGVAKGIKIYATEDSEGGGGSDFNVRWINFNAIHIE